MEKLKTKRKIIGGVFVLTLFLFVYQNCTSGGSVSVGSSSSASSTTSTLSISTQPSSQSATIGSYVSFYVYAKSSYSISYQWYKDGEEISGATSNSYIISSFESSDVGKYYAVITDGYTTLNSSTAKLSLTTTALSIVTQPSSKTASLGGSAVFSVTAESSNTIYYQWYKGSSAISDATDSSLTVSSITSSDYTNYYVVVSDSNSSITSSVVTLSETSESGLSKLYSVTYTEISTENSSCSSGSPYSMACRSAIDNICRDAGYLSGVGPLTISSSKWKIACLGLSSYSTPYFSTTFSEITMFYPTCTYSGITSTTCATAVQTDCNLRGYVAGWGPVQLPAYLSDAYSQINFICLDSTQAATIDVDTGDLTDLVSTCSPGTTVSTSCASASQTYCKSLGYTSGYGPVYVSGTSAKVVCLH